jgi:hypothetical protein
MPETRDAYGPYPRSAPARPYYGGRPYYPGRPYTYARPHAWWGWGWGWQPIYSYAPPPPSSEGEYGGRYAREEPPALSARFSLYGAGRKDGYAAGITFGMEGRYTGFDLDVGALAREQVTGPLHEDGSDPATFGNAHLTWSLVSVPFARVRLETGASILALPDSPAVEAQPWRGKTLFGPDVGLSGGLGLLGPLAIEGHARLTPFPIRIADTFLGVALHGGPLGVSAGWRWIDVDGDGKDAPKLMFRGPQVGLTLAL